MAYHYLSKFCPNLSLPSSPNLFSRDAQFPLLSRVKQLIPIQTVQYILLTPTYCNVINVYAFCNTHDVTWGTRAEEKAPVLANAKVGKDGKVDVDVSVAPDDLNALYEDGVKLFEKKAPEEVKVPNKNDVQEDYYKGFRSAVVLAWMFCNAVLIAVVLKSGGLSRLSVRTDEDEEKRKTQVVGIYLKVVLWSVVCIPPFLFPCKEN